MGSRAGDPIPCWVLLLPRTATRGLEARPGRVAREGPTRAWHAASFMPEPPRGERDRVPPLAPVGPGRRAAASHRQAHRRPRGFSGCGAQPRGPRRWQRAASPGWSPGRRASRPLGAATAPFPSARSPTAFHLENEPVWPRRGVMPIKAALLEMPHSLPLFYCSARAFCGLPELAGNKKPAVNPWPFRARARAIPSRHKRNIASQTLVEGLLCPRREDLG